MKIKARPENFVVYERADIRPTEKGDFSLYRLKKKGANTWDVLGDIAKRLRCSQDQIGYGGLKDRWALSYQFITIRHGPKRDLKGRNYYLEYLGPSQVPMTKGLLQGNFFRILVEEVSLKGLDDRLAQVERYGVVNYFDEQRFGSVRESKIFIAKELILGHYEKALWLLLTQGSQYEARRTYAFRRCIKNNWPYLKPCINLAPSKWEKSLLEFLSSHGRSKRTFKRAFTYIDKEYLLLLCQTYQAYLWNEIVKQYLRSMDLPLFSIPYVLGELYFYSHLPEEILLKLKKLKIPLLAPRLRLDSPLKEIVKTVLEREGLSSLERFRTLVKGAVFKTYPRNICVFPQGLKYQVRDDSSVFLEFFLPKGSYATLVLKRLFSEKRD